jgi:DNA damage-binding protein 1
LNYENLKFSSGQSNEEERKCLQNHGCIHLGEQINVFRHGSLGMQEQTNNELLSSQITGSILAGTVSGSIILFAQLSPLLYKILAELQARLGGFLVTAGKIQYSRWRDFESEKRVESSRYFIDGDLIESFLELSPTDAASLIKDFKVCGNFF